MAACAVDSGFRSGCHDNDSALTEGQGGDGDGILINLMRAN